MEILIAEDNDFNTIALKCLLTSFNVRADICYNGKSAVDFVQKRLQSGH